MRIGLLITGVVAMIGCTAKKNVEPEQLVPRQYDLPELDEEELEDLPEAGEDDTGEML